MKNKSNDELTSSERWWFAVLFWQVIASEFNDIVCTFATMHGTFDDDPCDRSEFLLIAHSK